MAPAAPPSATWTKPPTGKITEAQAEQFPEVQRIHCLGCRRPVVTPKGEAGYIVACPQCGGEVESIPF